MVLWGLYLFSKVMTSSLLCSRLFLQNPFSVIFIEQCIGKVGGECCVYPCIGQSGYSGHNRGLLCFVQQAAGSEPQKLLR